MNAQVVEAVGAQRIAGKGADVQLERSAMMQRQRAPCRVLEHLIAQATDQLDDDHNTAISGVLTLPGQDMQSKRQQLV